MMARKEGEQNKKKKKETDWNTRDGRNRNA